MSAMGESLFSVHAGRTHIHGQDLSPYTPVSSFNLPIHYDSSLITPVSLTQSPPISTTSGLPVQKDLDIDLSPTGMSPNYPFLGPDEEYSNREYRPRSSMKPKDPNCALHVSTADSSFSTTPAVCCSPYFGSFGVSAMPVSASESSPSMNSSSNMNSVSGLNIDGQQSRHNTPPRVNQGYRGPNQTPILLSTPNPLSLRPVIKQEDDCYHQNYIRPNSPGSATTVHTAFPETIGPLAPRRKRKAGRDSQDGEIVLSGDMSSEEKVLIQLTEKENLPWKEVAIRFKEQTGKTMKVPALQMRKKRLVERLRVWTRSEEQALTLAWEEYDKAKWETIANNMPKYGCAEKWPKELVQKKWHEMYPDDASYIPEYEIRWGMSQRDWSDGGESRGHSLHDGDTTAQISAITTPPIMEHARSRTASDVSSDSHSHLQFQQPQQHMTFETQQQQQQQQQQQAAWASGN